jgi:hypothetical protein
VADTRPASEAALTHCSLAGHGHAVVVIHACLQRMYRVRCLQLAVQVQHHLAFTPRDVALQQRQVPVGPTTNLYCHGCSPASSTGPGVLRSISSPRVLGQPQLHAPRGAVYCKRTAASMCIGSTTPHMCIAVTWPEVPGYY